MELSRCSLFLWCISFCPVLLGLADCTRFLSHAAGSMYQCRFLQASGWDGEAKVWKDSSGNSRHGVILGADWWQDENSVVYGDHEYRTLAGKPPDSLPGGERTSDYLVLLAGWRVALNDDGTREVVRRYPWGSRYLAFSGGSEDTAGCPNCGKKDYTAQQSGSFYRCNRWGDHSHQCDVLISRSRAYTHARQCTINASESSGHGASAPINSISG